MGSKIIGVESCNICPYFFVAIQFYPGVFKNFATKVPEIFGFEKNAKFYIEKIP